MYKNNVDMRVQVNGRPVREYTHQGMIFIESRQGSIYTIKIKNDNAFRVMTVVSVDGLDVITGKAADKSNKGYIVDAYSSTEIKGYRLSDEKSADFVFVSKDGKKNYASQAEDGDKRNSGVIGVRVFQEKPEKVKIVEKIKEVHHWHDNYYPIYPKYPWNPWRTPYDPITWYSTITYGQSGSSNNVELLNEATNLKYSNNSNTSLTSNTAKNYNTTNDSIRCAVTNNLSIKNNFDSPINYDNFDTGTGWGKAKEDRVRKEVFRKGKLVGELVIYYATNEALQNMGIDLTDTPKIAQMPKAFKDSEYCQPPKGWNG